MQEFVHVYLSINFRRGKKEKKALHCALHPPKYNFELLWHFMQDAFQ